MIENHGELSTSLPRGAENVSENPCTNSLVFAEKSLERERVLPGNSLRMEVCAEFPLGLKWLKGIWGVWRVWTSGPAQHWESWSKIGIFCWSQSSQTHRVKGTHSSHETNLCLIFIENVIYQLLFLAEEGWWHILRHQSGCVFKSHKRTNPVPEHRAGAALILLFLNACLY